MCVCLYAYTNVHIRVYCTYMYTLIPIKKKVLFLNVTMEVKREKDITLVPEGCHGCKMSKPDLLMVDFTKVLTKCI